MQIEGVVVIFIEIGIWVLVCIVVEVNGLVENIGVWWFYIVIEWVFEELFFSVFDCLGEMVMVDEVFVEKYLGDLVRFMDLLCYVF